MESLIQLIFVLALLKYCIKAALTQRYITIILFAVLCGIISLCFYPIVMQLPGNIISEILSNPKLIADGAVMITIEAITGIFISVKLLDNYFLPKQKRKKSMFIIKVLPGIIFVLALLYFELVFMKVRVGKDFMSTSILYSLIISVLISGVALIFKFGLKRESIKLEMMTLFNMFILITGLLVNAAVADYNTSYATSEIEWISLITMILIVSVLFGLGLLLFKYRKKKSFFLINRLYKDKL